MKKIYLKNVAGEICDIFENWLEEKNIIIPSEERDEYYNKDSVKYDETARLFGSDYYEMEDIAMEELNLFATGQYPSGLFEVVEDEISSQKGTEVIVSHFTALLDYHKLVYEEADKKKLIESIKNIFNNLEKMIQEEECEFETEYYDTNIELER